MPSVQEVVFAFDCAAPNWRINRAEYGIGGHIDCSLAKHNHLIQLALLTAEFQQ